MEAGSSACVALAFLVNYNTLKAGFVYDDSRAIVNNPDVTRAAPLTDIWTNDFWGTPIGSSSSHGSYRPLCVASFRLNHWTGGLDPKGYHVSNVLLHCAVTYLVYAVYRTLMPGRRPAAAAAVFAVHPVHAEAVAGVVGRADLLACLFYLAAFLCYTAHVRHRDRTPDPRRRVVCCDAGCHRRTYRLGSAVRTVFAALGLGTCSSDLDGLPGGVTECCAVREWACLAATVLMAAASMLAKETGLTVLAVCAVYDVLFASKQSPNKNSGGMYRTLAILSGAAAGLLFARMSLMGDGGPPVFAAADNPTAKSPSLVTRTLTFLYLPAENFRLLVYPRRLSFDWSMDAITPVTSVYDPRNALSIALYVALFTAARRSVLAASRARLHHHRPHRCCSKTKYDRPVDLPDDPARAMGLAVAMTAIPFVPVSNLFFYVGFVLAERVLYMPSVGYCFLFGYGYAALERRLGPKWPRMGLIVVLTVYGARTVIRNNDWQDDESLYRSGVHINPPKAYGNLGSILSSQGRLDEAETALRTALQYRPNMADVHYNLGNLLREKGDAEAAVSSYKNAIMYRPSLAVAYLNMGQLLATMGRCEEAESVLKLCVSLDGSYSKDPMNHETSRVSALVTLGKLHADRGRHSDAVQAYKHAVAILPPYYNSRVLFSLYGDALAQLNRHREAEMWHKAALEVGPDHVPAHLSYGKWLAKNRTRIHEAENWFLRAKKLAPGDASVYKHFGVFLLEQERYSEAASQLVEAVALEPEDYDLTVTAATALRQAGVSLRAEEMYRKAAILRPQDASSHSNLGAMLHLNGKHREALTSYQNALRISPDDRTTLDNLNKLRNVLRRRSRAA
ncbi:protein O-mannosyl-transferase TMTC2-like [Rhopalosiphum padi]|uniref:protein O-mannosyl-transferase TMTC2-like n=1 Tax=Rhopalosiphum padi TaxID=40932 RepID=UPI00298DD51A|nr:protein O-mannosyl-transferase TMTC2-like [Rhopalosiphum padi]XP_060851448.1 protein O-mannosyl-transferase TMTC2-like [Rhopalosiphum padi]XP_060851449.1 protein O-mannosyl-transferase TMTC2-like [Rhopalosiphum padi]